MPDYFSESVGIWIDKKSLKGKHSSSFLFDFPPTKISEYFLPNNQKKIDSNLTNHKYIAHYPLFVIT